MKSKNAYLQPTQLWWGKISRHNLLLFVISQSLQQGGPGRCGRVVSASTCQAGGLWFKSGILPLLKHTCGESDQLLCWLYTLAEVLHQRWISGNVYHVHLSQVRIRQNPLWLWNPEDTSPEVWNRGISGPKNGHVSNKNFKKKRSSARSVSLKCAWQSSGHKVWILPLWIFCVVNKFTIYGHNIKLRKRQQHNTKRHC